MKEFTRFHDLFRTGKDTKKYQTQLEKDALEWYKENFNAVFGSHSLAGKHHKYLWHYSVGSLIFDIKGIGDYYYKWTIMKLHFQHWKTKEFKQGFKYGFDCADKDTGHQDDNPYSDANFYSNLAWSCGFSMGLSKFSENENKKNGKAKR